MSIRGSTPHQCGRNGFFSAQGLRHKFFWRFVSGFLYLKFGIKMGKGRALAIIKGWHPFSVGVFFNAFQVYGFV